MKSLKRSMMSLSLAIMVCVNLIIPNVSFGAAGSINDFVNTEKTGMTASFSWSAASGATSIEIDQSLSGSNVWTTSKTGTISTAATSATVTGLSIDTAYDFRLVVTGGANAGISNVVTETTSKCILTFYKSDLDYNIRSVCGVTFVLESDAGFRGYDEDHNALSVGDLQISIESNYSFDLSALRATANNDITVYVVDNSSSRYVNLISSDVVSSTKNLFKNVTYIDFMAQPGYPSMFFQDLEFTNIKPVRYDQEVVEAAKDSLAVGYYGSDRATSVTQNVMLSDTGTDGASVEWSSDKPNVISSTGVVTRPSHIASDATVTLTATITKGNDSDTKMFTLKVLKQQTDAEAVAAAKGSVAVGYNGSDRATSVTQNVTLSTTGADGTSVAWSSDKQGVISSTGVVTRPSYTAGDATVTLTATITKGNDSDTKTFTLTVLKQLQTDAEAVAAAKGSVAVGYNGSNTVSSVTQNVTLSTTGTDGTSVAWSSDKPNVISPAGVVTRSSYTTGDATVTLTATITKGDDSDTKTFTLTVLKQPQTDAEAVAAAKGSVAVGYNGSDTVSSVTQNVTLGTTGTDGTSVAWSSNKQGVISTTGVVTRPSYTAGDATVTLTATITKGSETDTKTFTLTVLKQPQTDAEAVAAAKGSIAVGYNGSDAVSNVTQNVTLGTTGTDGTSVVWSSNKPNVISTTGVVTRPSYTAGDATVTLTATITKGSETDTKTFTLTVVKQPQTDADAVAAAKGSVVVGYNESDTVSSVTQNVTLSTTGTDGTSVAWSSNKQGVISTTGVVTRPSYTVGDATVTLTATITKGSETDTKTFTLTVLKQPQTDAEAVAAAAKGSVALGYNGSDTVSSVTQNVTLSTTGTDGTSVAWSSNKPTVIATTGAVTRPSYTAGDATVTLTATITKGNETDTKTFTLTVLALPAPPDSSSNSPISTSNPPTSTSDQIGVLVNGKGEKIGTSTTAQVNHQSVTTIAVDQQKLEDMLAAEGLGATVTIPFGQKSDVSIGELNGQVIKRMENKQAVLVIKTEQATYTLPAKLINISSILDQIGQSVALQDIKVKIEISDPSADTVKLVEDAAAKGTFTLVVPPIDFTVSAAYGDESVQVSKFSAYVERTIAIPDGVDPNQITTAVVVDPDGTVRHVPTRILLDNGKYYAKVNSLTNSTYAAVWHSVEFADVASHWAKQAINDMGSRMIIKGTGNDSFRPKLDITRAEFASIIVSGLGLKPESGTSLFSDIKPSDWYNGAINTAYSYELINGFEDGTFRPNDRITREQAMEIISKAMKLTGLKAKLAAASTDTLQPFADAADASTWALKGIAECVQAGIVSGRKANELAPQAFITRAEGAAMIQRLLQQSELI
ncbi:S-layer homology domain-containing protein [Cohnella abietis]|uniref:SLH domain-containing protein n=1 Tax=Cohnella abietis TaxID=2507935 RepID=A0A3T1DC50_9BACL|nr:S-layer homology domain-containing protein [Cohnella abietis]BBI35669.1 hypothetical protein KCTCHS21_50680 [Cohnella abietis]